MRRRFLVASTAALTLALLAGASEALACSCAGGTMKQRFKQADAALVARLISVEDISDQKAEYTYVIADVYKRRDRFEPGEELTLVAASYGASCGLPRRTDREYGLLMYRWSGRWNANLCTVVSAERLRRFGEERRGPGRASAASGSPGSADSFGRCSARSFVASDE